MPNGTRNNSKNKSNTIQNDRFKEIINYICTQYKINQNELMEKINEYMKYDFLSDNTLLSKYKRNTKYQANYYVFFMMNITLILIILKGSLNSNLMYYKIS